MRFMCLVNMDPAITSKLTEAEWKQFQQDNQEFDEELMAAGRFVMASPLDQPGAAITIRLRKGSNMVTDGPFVETKEYIAGFIIFEAKDKTEAAEIASRSAFTRVGSVELRALVEY
jgi:hypothetical protein